MNRFQRFVFAENERLDRFDRTVTHVKLAATLGQFYGKTPVVQVANVTKIPEQMPSETVVDDANDRVERITETLSSENISTEYLIEGHICRDIAFDVLQTARDDGADLILMGYPEEHPEIAKTVEAPCDVLYAQGFDDPTDVSTVNIGAGGGPHHEATLPLVSAMGKQGSDLHVISVTPTDKGGTAESTDAILAGLADIISRRASSTHDVV